MVGGSCSSSKYLPADLCARRAANSPLDFLADREAEGSGASSGAPSALSSVFLARDNPRQFFVRDPLPSTASAVSASSPSPSALKQAAPSNDGAEGRDGEREGDDSGAAPRRTSDRGGRAPGTP